MPYGRHIYAKVSDMARSKSCAYPLSDNVLTNWKCVLRCFAKFSSINLPYQEKYDQYYNTSPQICFHIYHFISRCTTHIRLTLSYKKCFCKCKYNSVSEQHTRIYTTKQVLMMETTISNSHTIFYIPEIKKLAFHIPYVQILGANKCGDNC